MKTTKLERLNACCSAINWVKMQKSEKDAWMNCDRGDWMLWLAQALNINDKKLTLAKAKCAEQVRHLMKYQKSIDALDACYKYVNGEITKKELNYFAAVAYAATTDVVYAANYTAYFAASAAYASAAAYFAASAADASAAAYFAAYSAVVSKTESLKKSADICREILTKEILKKYKNF